MALTLLPFLYQTRTLQRAIRTRDALLPSARLAHVLRRGRHRKPDNAIPFVWDHASPYDEAEGAPARESTITPSEAEIFRSIFDEIAQGRMPSAARKQQQQQQQQQLAAAAQGPGRASGEEALFAGVQKPRVARSIVEQARVMEFRDRILRRYPPSLRSAAHVALGLYDSEPGGEKGRGVVELDEANYSTWEERARYERARLRERERVDALMKACATDAELWRVMDEEVFSLPAKLGIEQRQAATAGSRGRGRKDKAAAAAAAAADEAEKKHAANGADPKKKKTTTTKKTKNAKTCTAEAGAKKKAEQEKRETNDAARKKVAVAESAADGEKPAMNVHGTLYSHFINAGLGLFDTAFARPSDYAFQILPRVKELGLPSYVLGVSTPFYARLARIHWNRFGDANAALDLLREMSSAGLHADQDVCDLLATIRNQLHGCAWGAQGPFVMGMMEAPPYDGTLTHRLAEMEKHVVRAMDERAAEMEAAA
ncbi:uncharacterized protein UV8b_07744 [Ustilaginoidea virens]|uniref:Mtf2-like C-terminal domain-containing protein n=1 Tax=Ustilaginoidea virens TaxID=1159556 RepID=A0A8E5HXU6_USTVR|nr:uncharacterized protein UV8b_07744 [Ustilaginoidea virens]QUC23503.1 hypothetical protein UV8b_07744 [Ustilaginoidea virens]